jgi:hypothetical protein
MSKSKPSPNDQPLDFSNTELLEWLRAEAVRAEVKRDDNVSSVNRTELALCGQVMLVTTVLLTGSRLA